MASPAAGPSHPTDLPRGIAALIGLRRSGPLGFGQLLAALLSPVSSPFLALGDTVINYSPEPVTEFAKVLWARTTKRSCFPGWRW